MTDKANELKEEAKTKQARLKESLKSKEPWDKDVEIQRKNLRRLYLKLLLVYPYTRDARDAETHLWMNTSYNFISSYKHRISVVDKAIQFGGRHHARNGAPGPVEYRRLMQRFRQFLAEEEKFWGQFVVRLRTSSHLDEAEQAIQALGIQTAEASQNMSPHKDPPRNQHQLPAESEDAPAPANAEQRSSRLAILSKALVCLGDIARYKELYNESGGRSRAGQEESLVPARKGGRGGRRGAAPALADVSRARNYEKAQQCYEQARLLVPHEGNPSHQLAILASYQKDLFGSLVHYYRALCVKNRYDTASENLGTVLNRALDNYKSRVQKTQDGMTDEQEDGTTPPRVKVEMFKEKVLALHALWRLGLDRMDSGSPKHAENVLTDFASLISERLLPIDTITKVVVLSEGALWKQRMIRDQGPRAGGSQASPSVIENQMFVHVLALHRILLQSGLVELAEAPKLEESADDLAQKITATFRRTLPALRVASKWLRGNLKYTTGAELTSDIRQYWKSYADFISALQKAFPPANLPKLQVPLEEDIEMSGFLPLRKLMFGETKVAPADNAEQQLKNAANVHPNEEQLMRMSDLLSDARLLSAQDSCPSVVKSVPGLVNEAHKVAVTTSTNASAADFREDDDDARTDTTKTDDDPVEEAMRKALDGERSDGLSDEDDDHIVWDPRGGASPAAIGTTSRGLPSPPSRPSPITPIKAPLSPLIMSAGQPFTPIGGSPFLAPASVRTPTSGGTTALDLLNTMKGNTRIGAEGAWSQQDAGAPQPQLLFGSDADPRLPGHSIWSVSHDHGVSSGGSPYHQNTRLASPQSQHAAWPPTTQRRTSNTGWPSPISPRLGLDSMQGVSQQHRQYPGYAIEQHQNRQDDVFEAGPQIEPFGSPFMPQATSTQRMPDRDAFYGYSNTNWNSSIR